MAGKNIPTTTPYRHDFTCDFFISEDENKVEKLSLQHNRELDIHMYPEGRDTDFEQLNRRRLPAFLPGMAERLRTLCILKDTLGMTMLHCIDFTKTIFKK